jgi:hypothetical protein
MKVMIPPPDLWGSTGYVATTEERFKEREEVEEEWGNKEGKRNSLRSCSRQREVIPLTFFCENNIDSSSFE